MIGERAGGQVEARVQALCARLDEKKRHAPLPRLAWKPGFDRAAYERQIERVLGYIRAGDIFQANFTMRYLALRPQDLDTQALYLRAPAGKPSPFRQPILIAAPSLRCSAHRPNAS